MEARKQNSTVNFFKQSMRTQFVKGDLATIVCGDFNLTTEDAPELAL